MILKFQDTNHTGKTIPGYVHLRRMVGIIVENNGERIEIKGPFRVARIKESKLRTKNKG